MTQTHRFALVPVAALGVAGLAVTALAQQAPPEAAREPAADQRQTAPPAPVDPAARPLPPDTGAGSGDPISRGADTGGALDGVKSAEMVGLPVFGSDGAKVGEVSAIKVGSDGALAEVHVRTGGILGFGARVVKVPADKVSKSGQALRLAMSSQEVGKLPEADGKKG